MRPGSKDQGAFAFLGQDGADGSHVAHNGRLVEAGNLRGIQGGGGFANEIGGFGPAGTEDQGYVVGLNASLGGNEVRGGPGSFERVCVHQLSVTHWYKLPCACSNLVGTRSTPGVRLGGLAACGVMNGNLELCPPKFIFVRPL